MSKLEELRKSIIKSIELASLQNKAFTKVIEDQYKLLSELSKSISILQKQLILEKDYLKQTN